MPWGRACSHQQLKRLWLLHTPPKSSAGHEISVPFRSAQAKYNWDHSPCPHQETQIHQYIISSGRPPLAHRSGPRLPHDDPCVGPRKVPQAWPGNPQPDPGPPPRTGNFRGLKIPSAKWCRGGSTQQISSGVEVECNHVSN